MKWEEKKNRTNQCKFKAESRIPFKASVVYLIVHVPQMSTSFWINRRNVCIEREEEKRVRSKPNKSNQTSSIVIISDIYIVPICRIEPPTVCDSNEDTCHFCYSNNVPFE